MKIWIGCDHAGYERKQEVIALLKERQLEVEDCGCDGERADYPVIAKAVGAAVASHSGDMGILICGTGIGMSIAANKIRWHSGCRTGFHNLWYYASFCTSFFWNPLTESLLILL